MEDLAAAGRSAGRSSTLGQGQLSLEEAVKLGAVDHRIFDSVFFPKAARSASPPFQSHVCEALDDPRRRLLNLQLFRGSGKTTRLRIFTAKRIAYSVSRTILYVGASEAHAVRSIQWLRAAVEKNKLFSGTFGLRPGRKWQENEIEIFHGIDEQPIWIMGAGITGNIRGINFDDYRPDLIILDDVITDENAATPEQREKINNLVLGALKQSLAPASEEPNAKLVALQTPLDREDFSTQALRDPQWNSMVFGCWTEESKDLPLEQRVSSWPERFPTAELQQDKKSHIQLNRVSIFNREMEVHLSSPETASFKPNWLRTDKSPDRNSAVTVLSIDPVPPPSDRELARSLKGKDFEAHAVWTRTPEGYFLREYVQNKGHEPNWSTATALDLAQRYRVLRIVINAVGYEKTLKFLLEQEMQRRGIYFAVVPVTDNRSKFIRITGAFSGIGAQGKLFCSPGHSDFIESFESYPSVSHDDLLDASATAVNHLISPMLEGEAVDPYADEGDAFPLRTLQRCP